MPSRTLIGIVGAAFLSLGALTLSSSAQDQSQKVESVFKRIEDAQGANLVEGIRELEELGRGTIDDVRKGLTRADAYVRIAAARVLYAFDERQEALEHLSKILSSKNAGARRVAAELITSLVATDRKLPSKQRSETANELRKLADEQDDDLARITLLRGVWSLTERLDARRSVRDILEKAKKKDVRDEAALALAEMDAFIWAKGHLQTLASEPTEKGRLARAYLKVNQLTEDINRGAGKMAAAGGKYDYTLVDEVIDTLKETYHDAAKVEDTQKLVEAAARGILSSLDHYTAYYDEKAIDQLRKEELEGHYGGIGARVSMRKDKAGNSWLTIDEPIFSGPAYRAGLRSHDTILEVDGELTANQEVGDLVRKLRGKPGTPVKIKVRRGGWTKDRDYSIVREEIQLETTISRLLPGQIGYVKYTTFGDLDDELRIKGTNIEKEIENLAERGMKAFILDLRGNSGGYLRTARRIASMFLEDDAVIVRTKSRGQVREEYRAEGGPLTKVPMVVLVDDGSASASEILAGALQDHKRAILVGQKTFGKGSVQELKPLKSTDAKTAARLTVAKWYLPSDRSVEKDNPKDSGIEPDIKVTEPDRDFWKLAEFERLRADGRVQEYVEQKFDKHKELFVRLADCDYNDPGNYPEFDALVKSLGSKLEPAEIRELVREMVRKKVQDEQGKALYIDYQTDAVLQRGIAETCKTAGIDLKGIKEYGVFVASAGKVAAEDKKENNR